MMDHFITFRSVTFAQHGQSILEKSGIQCLLQRTPRWMEEQGCGYCLRLRGADVFRAVRWLQARQIKFRKVYRQLPDGNVEELAL